MSDDEAAKAKDRRTKIIEIIEVSVLSVVAILTAWSGYQGTKWGGLQSMLYAQASSIRLQADELGDPRRARSSSPTPRSSRRGCEAHHTDDRSLEAELERRFSPEYASAFHDWLAHGSLHATRTPRPDPPRCRGSRRPSCTQAAQMNDQAGALLTEGTDARDTANEYVRATVLFASVLLLVAIAQRFSIHGVRIAANVLALVLLAYAVWSVARLPRI